VQNTKQVKVNLGLFGGAIFALFFVFWFSFLATGILLFFAVFGILYAIVSFVDWVSRVLRRRKHLVKH
jgi:hypothetical protein